MEINDIEKLNVVWQRVMPESEETVVNIAEAPENDTATLERFIQNEFNGAESYAALARRCRRPDRARLFSALAEDEREHVARLQTAYFLLTGESFMPKAEMSNEQLNMTTVRQKYLNELADEKAYKTAAEKTKNPRLRAVYEANARDEKRHADTLEKLIAEMMR